MKDEQWIRWVRKNEVDSCGSTMPSHHSVLGPCERPILRWPRVGEIVRGRITLVMKVILLWTTKVQISHPRNENQCDHETTPKCIETERWAIWQIWRKDELLDEVISIREVNYSNGKLQTKCSFEALIVLRGTFHHYMCHKWVSVLSYWRDICTGWIKGCKRYQELKRWRCL